MTVYTPPSLSAVDFQVSEFVPEVLIPNEIALQSYTPPALNAVDFALTAHTPLTFSAVDFELLSNQQNIVGASFTNLQTFGSGTIENVAGPQEILGTSFTNNQTFGSGIITQSGTTPEPPPAGVAGGPASDDDGVLVWNEPSKNFELKKFGIEEMKDEIWAENNKPQISKSIQVKVKKSDKSISEEELLLAWWFLNRK